MTRWFTLAFVLFLLLVVFWANTGTMPVFLRSIYQLPYGDKLGHFSLYAILAFLLNLSLHGRQVRMGGRLLLVGTLAALAVAAFEEISQLFQPLRTPDLVDFGAGALGILLADWVYRWRKP